LFTPSARFRYPEIHDKLSYDSSRSTFCPVSQMKILITGSAGQLGRSLIDMLAKHQVQGAGRDRLDITDLARVRDAIEALAPDLVINTAAYNDVDGAETDPTQAYRVNALGPRNLALAAASAGVALMHLSTDFVFDGAATRPYHEYDRPNPISVYGASKLAGEQAVRDLNHRHYVVRTAWLFHPGGRNFVNRMRALSDRPQIKVANDQVGSPTYAPHLAAAIAELIETEAYGTYHMGGQGEASRFELIRFLFSTLNLKTEVLPVPHTEFANPAPRPSYSALTTIQEPRIVLPPWQDGAAAFVRSIA
jgi:dTDP-4-dehydrorhamnose reductase